MTEPAVVEPAVVEHANLAEALVAVQRDAPTLHTDDTATVTPKQGRSYSYSYLTLGKLRADVRPLLAAHGLALVARPAGTAQAPTLLYTLMHASGETLEGEMPLYLGGQTSAQAHGSAITYARRYAELALLGLAPEDDDGRGASDPPSSAPAPSGPPPPRPLSDEERERVIAGIGAAGLSVSDALAVVGATPEDWTAADARTIRTWLDAEPAATPTDAEGQPIDY